MERIPAGRSNDVVAELAPPDKKATRAEAIAAWMELEELDHPKDWVWWSSRERLVRLFHR